LHLLVNRWRSLFLSLNLLGLEVIRSTFLLIEALRLQTLNPEQDIDVCIAPF